MPRPMTKEECENIHATLNEDRRDTVNAIWVAINWTKAAFVGALVVTAGIVASIALFLYSTNQARILALDARMEATADKTDFLGATLNDKLNAIDRKLAVQESMLQQIVEQHKPRVGSIGALEPHEPPTP